jgi:threonine dehydrogenase-like Zn-dependent dehydrogenase
VADVVRAVVQTRPRQLEMREFPRPVIGPEDGALLRVEACGICGTDVEQYRGAMGTRSLPMVPRHEPFGIIEEISPMTAERWGVQAGDHGMPKSMDDLIPGNTKVPGHVQRAPGCPGLVPQRRQLETS